MHVYDIATHKLDTLPLGKVYGVQNLYQDVSAKDVMELEKALAKLENHGAAVIAMLHKAGSNQFSLKRKDVNYLQKFLFIMHYRQSKLSHSYFQDDHPENKPLIEWMTHFRAKHGLTTSTEFWLYALRYYIDTPHFQICMDAATVYRKYTALGVTGMMMPGGTVDPAMEEGWLAIAYAAQDNLSFLGFWEAADGTEFILSQNSFGLWEGLFGGSRGLHRIYVVSPRFAIVLRQNIMAQPNSINPLLNTDFIDIEQCPPVITSANAPNDAIPPNTLIQPHRGSDDDIFVFTITKLTEKQMQTFNSVILSNVRADGSITFLSRQYALQATRTHLVSFLNFLDRPRYQPLIQELSSSVTPLTSAQNIAAPASVHSNNLYSDSVSDMELYELLLNISTGVKTFQSSADRAQAIFQLVRTSRNTRSSFAADYRLSVEPAIQRCLRSSNFSRERHPPVKFLVSMSAEHSERLFKAMTPYMESLGVKLASPDLLDQLLHEVVIHSFLGWAAHDEEVFNAVKNSSAALMEALSAQIDSNRDSNSNLPHVVQSSPSASLAMQDPAPDTESRSVKALKLELQKMVANPSQLRSRYDRAYTIWKLFTAIHDSDAAVNPFCIEVRRISSGAIARFSSFLRPPPAGFTPNLRAELVMSMPERESVQLFTVSEVMMERMGIIWAEKSNTIGVIISDICLLVFLLWVLKNRGDILGTFFPGVSLLKR